MAMVTFRAVAKYQNHDYKKILEKPHFTIVNSIYTSIAPIISLTELK